MIQHFWERSATLLSLCAIMQWFDRDTLGALTENEEDVVEELLASDVVLAARSGAYQLREDDRTSTLARLRSELPHTEPTLQARIFGYFLASMRKAANDQQRAAHEERSFHHLKQLVIVLIERMEWDIIARYAAAANAAQPQHPRHLRQLRFYDGYVAIRTQRYSHGQRTLLELLADPAIEDREQAPIMITLGHMHLYQNRFDRALDFYQQGQVLAQRTNEPFYEAQATIASSMIYSELGDYTRAIEKSTASLQLARQIGSRYREAHALYEIGNNAMSLGRWHDAQAYFQQAIGLYEGLGVERRLHMLYWMQGFLHHLLGDEATSEAAYLRILVRPADATPGEPSIQLDAWLYLGLLYQAQGRWRDALQAYNRASVLAKRLDSNQRLFLIRYRRGNIFERIGQIDKALAAYRHAISGIEALRGEIEAEAVKIGLLGSFQQVYESIVLLLLAQGRNAEAFAYVERARSQAFLDLLAKKQAQSQPEKEFYTSLAQPIVTLTELQTQLRDDTLLVEYFTIGVVARGESLLNTLPTANTRLREHLTLRPQLLLFAITRDRLEVMRPALDPNTLRPQPSDPGPGRRLLRDRLLTHLHEQLIAPIAPALAGCAQLYIIPHGPLHYVPFMALRSADGEHLLQAHGPAIALAPSATVLLRNCLNRPRSQGRAHYALGYNDTGTAALHYAEAEAHHVARLIGGQAWTGAQPKSAQLIASGQHIRWLHIAGHAIYDPHDPLGSYLKLGAGDTLDARAIMRELDLNADLVTLSACMSGLTHVVSGDELLGLQRAWLYAGAPAVICTLWEAADLVALLVMDQFYTALGRGQPPAAALRDAQVLVRAMTGRDLLATVARWRANDPDFAITLDSLPALTEAELDQPLYADPFYWAPFMLIGRPD